MEAPKDYQERIGRPLPNKFQRGLDALVVGYPGCERDLVIARKAVEMGSKKDFLKAFRNLKGRQVAYEHYQEMKGSENWISEELEYPGSEADKRELQTWFYENPPTEENVKIFKERVEGLRNKNAAVQGDRSHPNIAALLKLQLTYPGCEEDVQEALQIHYSRPLTQFPHKLHSLKAKQDFYRGDRNHWRLVNLDDLELTYLRWQKDVEAVEDWHIHNAENRENDVLFHEIIEGMLEKEATYLEWIHQRRFSGINQVEGICRDDLDTDETRDLLNMDREEDDSILDEDIYETKWDQDASSFDKYYVVAREERNQKISKQLRFADEEREPQLDDERS
jgi:hypothetical protein